MSPTIAPAPPERYPAVGRCIYCDATEHSKRARRLGDEHIIPEGLNGTLVLPEASCGRCEGITSAIEQLCLKKLFGHLRYKFDMRTKRRKDRPKVLPVELLIHSRWQVRHVPVIDYPMILMLPYLPMPTMLVPSLEYLDGVPCKFFRIDLTPPSLVNQICGKYGATSMRTKSGAGDDVMLSRFLAKIAHAFAVAEYGYGNFKPYLLDIIKGDASRRRALIGASQLEMPKTFDSLHFLYTEIVRKNDKYLIRVDVRLLSQFGCPQYVCIAGEHLMT